MRIMTAVYYLIVVILSIFLIKYYIPIIQTDIIKDVNRISEDVNSFHSKRKPVPYNTLLLINDNAICILQNTSINIVICTQNNTTTYLIGTTYLPNTNNIYITRELNEFNYIII